MTYPALSLFIDGEFVPGGRRDSQPIFNPATSEQLSELPHATAADLDRALAAAQRAFITWQHTPALQRAAVLRKAAALMRERAHDIARNITLDHGKPLHEAVAEVSSCAEHAEWHAEECRRIYGRVIPARTPGVQQMVLRQPVGVCAAFTPWNFPMGQAVRKVAAAIGAGCTMVLKGPEDTPSAIVAMVRIFADAGLPPGVLNAVWGVPAEVSTHLIRSPIVRKVTFTGSVPVGRQLAAMAGERMQRVTMELGGHAPVLVFADADIEAAVRQLVAFKQRNAGQVCISPTRFFLHESIYDRFTQAFVDAYAGTRVGNGLSNRTEMGPLVNRRRVATMESFVADALERGGRVLTGGHALRGEGSFFAPTVLADVSDNSRVMTDEPFGPIAVMTRFKTTDEVLARANALEFGLSSYVFTESLKTAQRVGRDLECGMVNINHFGAGLPETPLGGMKASGIGSEGGSETFDGYLTTKFVTQI